MSNVIRVKKEKRYRESNLYYDDDYILWLKIRVNDLYIYSAMAPTFENGSEARALQQLICRAKKICDVVPNLKENVVKTFERLREKKIDENGFHKDGTVDVQPLTPKQVKSLTHVSCRRFFRQNKFTRPATRYWTSWYGFDQRDLKQRVQGLDKSSEAYKFFTGHNCSVCLRNYKEILDDGHHIVVADCCHVYCCSCLDEMIKSKDNKRCPECRRAFWPEDFSELLLNIDYKPNLDLHGMVFFS